MLKLLSVFLLISLTGCISRSGPSEELIEGKNSELSSLSKSRIVSVVNEPYMGARAIMLPKHSEFSSGVFTRQITLNKRGTLAEMCAAISTMTGLPISVQGGSGGSVKSGAPSPSGASLDAELKAALGDTGLAKSPRAPAVSSASHVGSGGFRIAYSGTVKGLLDLLASRTGLSWDYNADTGISFVASNVKTFTIWAAPGKVSFSNQITNQSKDSSSASGSGGASSQDSSMQTAQMNKTELSFDVWKDVETEVKGILTGGSVTINQAAGTITVRDTPQTLQQVSRYVGELNERLSKQIALSIKVWSLEVDESAEAGINLSIFFENPDVKVFAGASPLKFLGIGGDLSAAIVDGKLKDTTALLKGLRSVGKATQVTSGGGVVMSNQPVPVQAVRREAYLASSSRTISDTGNTTELIPGEVTTGFAMTVIPHIMEARRVVLQYTVNLSSLDDLTEFSSGESTIQLPKVSTRSFSQRMTIKMGQTLVLAGFEQEVDGGTTQGGILGIGRSRQYKKSLIVITISTEAGDV